MSNKKILIVNDITGYGRVSTLAMLPIFTKYGLHPYILPTALVSNATEYGSPIILNTDDYMRSTVEKWESLHFKFDYICTGFINSEEQVDIILELIQNQDRPFILVDPIMADSGELYEGIYEGVVECNRKLAAIANILLPNLTEAELLAGKYVGRSNLTDEEYHDLVSTLSTLCPNDIVITGCTTMDNKHFNLVYSSSNQNIQYLYYDNIADHFTGTGDVFSACLLSEKINNTPLDEAVAKAATRVAKIILHNVNNLDHYDIQIENCL